MYAWYALVMHRMCGSRAEYVYGSGTHKKERRRDGTLRYVHGNNKKMVACKSHVNMHSYGVQRVLSPFPSQSSN